MQDLFRFNLAITRDIALTKVIHLTLNYIYPNPLPLKGTVKQDLEGLYASHQLTDLIPEGGKVALS